MTQLGLFGDTPEHPDTRATNISVEKRVLITVTTAPNPSSEYRETVCVAGLELDDFGAKNWIRLYPINLRPLRKENSGFRKYDIITVTCRPAPNDSRVESWRPELETIRVQGRVNGWEARKKYIEKFLGDTQCDLAKTAQTTKGSRSLGLVPARRVRNLDLENHPGWSREEQAKIERYVNQLSLFDDEDVSPLEAPRLKGFYNYLCMHKECTGHRQQILDWEFVAFQRRFKHLRDAELREAVRTKFLEEVCASDRAVAFYVGNLAKRHHTFSVLGVYWPKAVS